MTCPYFRYGLNKENWIEGIVSVDIVVDNDFKLTNMKCFQRQNDKF